MKCSDLACIITNPLDFRFHFAYYCLNEYAGLDSRIPKRIIRNVDWRFY